MVGRTDQIEELRHAAGREILALTDQFGFDAFAAGWLHDRAAGTWRYILVTPMLRRRGPKWIYERLLRLFRHHPLPEGISPLDIQVIDPEMEVAAFGPPLLAMDERDTPDSFAFMLKKDLHRDDFLALDGFVVLYRRLPDHLRARMGDPGRRFDLKVRELDRAA